MMREGKLEQAKDVKLIAFHLPQFHTFPENDEWWGKGFTEWVNVKKASKLFPGHNQPREPLDQNYYDLLSKEILLEQAELSQKYGIDGFCYYHYWFHGKKLMEGPLEMLLENKDIPQKFCLCWANEPWTRNWDGKKSAVLMPQEYGTEGDWELHFKYLSSFFRDERYICVDNKPLFVIYRTESIPEIEKMMAYFSRRAVEELGTELFFLEERNGFQRNKVSNQSKGVIEFEPMYTLTYGRSLVQKTFQVLKSDLRNQLYHSKIRTYDYRDVWKELLHRTREQTASNVYSCAFVDWDNSPRRGEQGIVFLNSSPQLFRKYLKQLVADSRKRGSELVFINAWNEWAEGCYLEPDETNRHGYLEAVADVVGKGPSVAVQVHCYYLDILSEISHALKQIPVDYDCYVSTDTHEKKKEIEKTLKTCGMKRLVVDVFPNKGRDVMPFLLQMQEVWEQYQYLCHFHTKKTITSECGQEWCKYLLHHLFGERENVLAILQCFEKDNKIGMIYPETFPAMKTHEEWGSNRSGVKRLLHKMKCDVELKTDVEFPVGDMFWARVDAIAPVLGYPWKERMFPREKGQIDGTLMHQIERCWRLVAEQKGYQVSYINNDGQKD